MKKILIALAFCGVAHADTVATLRNKAGGLIVLTDVKTDRCREFTGTAYTSGSGNSTYWGCWFTDDLMVHIKWLDGETTAYLIENFTINDEWAKKNRSRGKRYDY